MCVCRNVFINQVMRHILQCITATDISLKHFMPTPLLTEVLIKIQRLILIGIIYLTLPSENAQNKYYKINEKLL
jgi:hypothetical protein